MAESADVLQGQDSALWHRRTHTQAAGHLGGQAALCCFYQKRTGTGSSPHRQQVVWRDVVSFIFQKAAGLGLDPVNE